MTEVVRSPPPDLREILNLVPDAPEEICIIDRRSFVGPENPFFHIEGCPIGQRLLLSIRPKLFELSRKFGAHIDLPLRCDGFGRLDLAVVRDVPPNNNVVLGEIDVDPLNRRHLADPHSGSCHAEDENIVLRKSLFALGFDLMEFLNRERIDLLLDLLGGPVELAELHNGIDRDDAFVDRLLPIRSSAFPLSVEIIRFCFPVDPEELRAFRAGLRYELRISLLVHNRDEAFRAGVRMHPTESGCFH